MNVTPYQQQLILHFGEMGRSWGVNRTVGQMYALLFLSHEPLNAEQIAAALELSRSNVSLGVKELQAWHLVRLQHKPGDRRDYFSAPADVWEIFETLLREKSRREVDPTLSKLADVLKTPPAKPSDQHAQKRMTEMYELIELVTKWFTEMQSFERDTLIKLIKLGAGVRRVLEARPGGRNKDSTDGAN